MGRRSTKGLYDSAHHVTDGVLGPEVKQQKHAECIFGPEVRPVASGPTVESLLMRHSLLSCTTATTSTQRRELHNLCRTKEKQPCKPRNTITHSPPDRANSVCEGAVDWPKRRSATSYGERLCHRRRTRTRELCAYAHVFAVPCCPR